ncbi:MAG: hypothetical protein OXD32_05185 [Endozoicomonadaceae bacterium]|nr:hypothetical protein [Endozoicomonadaceae bacterium]MCY4329597.1 hypothetical protein [Endozoicomonadaceae bacterium]
MAWWSNHEGTPQLTPSPSPATSNAACGFAALRLPALHITVYVTYRAGMTFSAGNTDCNLKTDPLS